MYTAAAIAVLVATSAPAASARRGLRFSLADINDGDFSDFGDAPVSVTNESGSSGVDCHSTSDSGAQTEMRDAHITAVSLLVADFCDPHFDGDASVVFNRVEEYGGAIATAFAKATAECKATGGGSGCTTAKATAEAWADATASVHVLAAAKLIDECSCLKVHAESIVFGKASEFVALSAQAFAEAEVKACASGEQTSRAEASISCTAAAFVKVWGEAIAGAFLDNGCLSTDVATKLTATANYDATLIETCPESILLEGNAQGSVSGNATADLFDFDFDGLQFS
eukprot:jgi/Ulvmu1/10699/UM067_0025.1